MKRTTIFLTEQLLERLSKYKEATGLGMADIIRRAIEEFLDKREKR